MAIRHLEILQLIEQKLMVFMAIRHLETCKALVCSLVNVHGDTPFRNRKAKGTGLPSGSWRYAI